MDPPRYLLRDRDAIYRTRFRKHFGGMGFQAMLTAPRSPWQSPYVERPIGTIRRGYLDHVIVLNEGHLKRLLADYFDYYHRWRTHQSLGMDCPQPREVHSAAQGRVAEVAEVGGLHHHCERVAA